MRDCVYEGEGVVSGSVEGGEDNVYKVTINLNHPRKSSCDCPFADGRTVICKHMIALYFTSEEGSYEAFEEDMRRLEAEYELREERDGSKRSSTALKRR